MDELGDHNLSSKRRAVLVACVAVSAPYVARLCAIPLRGEDWFFDYLGNPALLLVGFLFNLLLGYVLYVLIYVARGGKPAKWVAAFLSISYVVVVNFAFLDLGKGSTAGIAVFTTPLIATAIAMVSWWCVGKLDGRENAV
jgi:hypothetical protein